MLIGKLMLSSPSSNILAMMILTASVGWYASQNTYFDRSSHWAELFALGPLKQTNGGKYPPQHGALAFSNPNIIHTHKKEKKKNNN